VTQSNPEGELNFAAVATRESLVPLTPETPAITVTVPLLIIQMTVVPGIGHPDIGIVIHRHCARQVENITAGCNSGNIVIGVNLANGVVLVSAM